MSRKFGETNVGETLGGVVTIGAALTQEKGNHTVAHAKEVYDVNSLEGLVIDEASLERAANLASAEHPKLVTEQTPQEIAAALKAERERAIIQLKRAQEYNNSELGTYRPKEAMGRREFLVGSLGSAVTLLTGGGIWAGIKKAVNELEKTEAVRPPRKLIGPIDSLVVGFQEMKMNREEIKELWSEFPNSFDRDVALTHMYSKKSTELTSEDKRFLAKNPN